MVHCTIRFLHHRYVLGFRSLFGTLGDWNVTNDSFIGYLTDIFVYNWNFRETHQLEICELFMERLENIIFINDPSQTWVCSICPYPSQSQKTLPCDMPIKSFRILVNTEPTISLDNHGNIGSTNLHRLLFTICQQISWQVYCNNPISMYCCKWACEIGTWMYKNLSRISKY